VKDLPPPKADRTLPLRALIFDSYYDAYRGVVVFFRVIDGEIKKGDRVRFMASTMEYEVLEVGVMTPVQVKVDVLRAGEVGFMSAAIRAVDHARVGDTIAYGGPSKDLSLAPLPGYSPAKQMVFCGLYPTDSDDYEKLRDAIGKLKLNDAALSYMPEVTASINTIIVMSYFFILYFSSDL
jgi:GTP-binding protein LepA